MELEEEKTDLHSHEEMVFSKRRSSLSESEHSTDLTNSYMLIPYGFQSKAYYKPKSKSKEITGVTYNSRSRQFILLDSKGVTAWSCNNVVNSVSRLYDYPPYQFNLIRLLLHSKKYNVYFGLSKDYALKVYNLNFHEVFSVVSDMNSVLCMVFNSVTDELITGGTGGVKFWSFGEIEKTEPPLVKDSRPMASYGLILRYEHPGMGGSWVKDIILDERHQRLYCLSERNVIAYDMEGNFLFILKRGILYNTLVKLYCCSTKQVLLEHMRICLYSAHQGLVTGCVYSKYSNFVVTGGTDCTVKVWSSNGGYIHTFTSHSKMITSMLIHPEAPSLVITSSEDGTVKIFSLDIMEEIYSHMVFAEGVMWMNHFSSDLLYCATSKGLQVFSINHVADFWATVRCPLKQLSLSASRGKTPRIIAIAEDNSTKLLSKTSDLLSTVLPPPSVTTTEHDKPCVSAHAYSPLYGLMYLLVNQQEIWVYYTKTNPANRVEVWQLSDVRDIKRQDSTKRMSCSPNSEPPRPSTISSERIPSRSTGSPALFSSGKVVDGVPCRALALLNSPIFMTSSEEPSSDIKIFLVAGLQDGRLLFLSPFAASLMYHQFQASKGVILSIQHDATHNSLALIAITLNEYAIQIRSLPHLELKYLVNVGSDFTCFVRMNELILSGHENGRLNLHHLTLHGHTSEQVTSSAASRNSSTLRKSKDHLGAVLSVDGNEELKVFCSSSKDGCIKIWDDTKILLREIIMDGTLSVVCFLNSSGDLLAGFKSHIFVINHERAHLSFHNKDANVQVNKIRSFDTESVVYEDPRIRFEYKKAFPPEPVCMETYLVPFANMSINLARYLSGHLSSTTSEDDENSQLDESESELSDIFSVAPTEVYMSQGDTPLSRSRSSSLVSSWDLPRLGYTPVSSPPRTPPPVMTPVVESDSEEEESSKSDDHSESQKDNSQDACSLHSEPPKKEKQTRNTNVIPVFSRRKRPGLSQMKIDSRALRSKAKMNSERRGELEGNMRDGHEENTKTNGHSEQLVESKQASRPSRSVVKKTKKNLVKLPRRVARQQSVAVKGLEKGDILQEDAQDEISDYNAEEEQRQEQRQDQQEEQKEDEEVATPTESKPTNQETTHDHSSKNVHTSSSSQVTVNREGKAMEKVNYVSISNAYDQRRTGYLELDTSGNTEKGGVVNTTDESTSVKSTSVTDPPSLITNTQLTDTHCETSDFYVQTDCETENVACNEEEMINYKVGQKTELCQNTSFETQSMPQGTSHKQPNRSIKNHCEVIEEPRVLKEELDIDEERTSSSDIGTQDSLPEEEEEKKQRGKPVSKTVLFVDSAKLEDDVIAPWTESPLLKPSSFHLVATKSSIRRSPSPVNPSPKVVPILNTQFVGDEDVPHFSPSSALKIYALARTHPRSSSGKPLVSSPRVGPHHLGEHHTSHESFSADDLREVYDAELERIIGNHRNVMDTPVTEERKKPREKKDLVNWCLRALSEKTKYPVFSPKPRLRSRRSINLDKKEAEGEGGEEAELKKPLYNDFDALKQARATPSEQSQNEFKVRKPEQETPEPNPRIWLERKSGENVSFRKSYFSSKEYVNKPTQSMPNFDVYSEGWQDRYLDRARTMKEKRLERQRKVEERRRQDVEALEEKRNRIWGYTERGGIELDVETSDPQMIQTEAKTRKTVSSFENFKNKPQISHPYRLGKFDLCNDGDGSWMAALGIDPNSQRLADNISDLIPRPKSVPSIPSKCRKYMLVASESDNLRSMPEPTPLEETLLSKRFPKTKSKLKSRNRFSQSPGLLRSHSVAKTHTIQMS